MKKNRRRWKPRKMKIRPNLKNVILENEAKLKGLKWLRCSLRSWIQFSPKPLAKFWQPSGWRKSVFALKICFCRVTQKKCKIFIKKNSKFSLKFKMTNVSVYLVLTDRHANKCSRDVYMQSIINSTDVNWDKQLIYFKLKIPINSRFKQIFFQHAIQYIMPDDIWHSSIWAIRMYVMEILVKILVIFDLHTIMNWSGLNTWNTPTMPDIQTR